MTTASNSTIPPESSAPILLWALPLLGTVLIPGLWWTSADRPYAFRPDLVVTMTLFVAIVTVGLLAVVSRGFQRRIRWSMGVTTSLVITGFLWRPFTFAGETVAEATGVVLASDVVPVVLAGGLLWLTVRLADERNFALIVAAAVAAMVGTLGFIAVGLVAPAPPALVFEPAASGSPDVLLLVLDGYGRADWLAAEYDFDNTEFLEELESRGFAIASEATPNYGYTFASVSAMLNLDYVFDTGEISGEERKQMRAAMTGASGLIPAFKEGGYEIAYLENPWGGSLCGSSVDWCIKDELVERSLWTLAQMTIFAPVVNLMRATVFNTVADDQLNALGNYVTAPRIGAGPRLFFAHILLPHAPLLLDASCARQDQDQLRYWGLGDPGVLEARRANYVEQVRCVNSRVLEAVDALISTSPESIVMITGDHGPGSILDVNFDLAEISDTTIAERMKILSAYRLPGCEDSFRVDLTPVNGTRIVANCALGSDLERLPDENRWADLGGTGIVTDITAKVRSLK